MVSEIVRVSIFMDLEVDSRGILNIGITIFENGVIEFSDADGMGMERVIFF